MTADAKAGGTKLRQAEASCAIAVLLLAVYASAALAQSGPVSSSPLDAQAPVSNTEQKPVPALPAKTPPTCDAYLPARFTVPQTAGTTFVSYQIDVSGAWENASLYRSSGNSDLDKAALACVSAMKIIPSKGSSILVNGKPADVTLIGGVFWKNRFHTFGNPTPDGTSNHCVNGYPVLALRLDEQGTVAIRVQIAADGSVQNTSVAQSSGFPALDQASVDCVKSYRFLPATQNGQPVEIERTLRVDWKLGRTPERGPMVGIRVAEDGSVRLEGQKYSDADALRAKLAEIASRNPRPEICELPTQGPAFALGSLTAMSRALHLLNAAGVPSMKFCTAPFAEISR